MCLCACLPGTHTQPCYCETSRYGGCAVSRLLGYWIHLHPNCSNHWDIHADLLDLFNDHPSDWSDCPAAPFSNILFPLCLHHSQFAKLLTRFRRLYHYLSAHCSKTAWGYEGCFGQKQTIVLFILMLCLPGCIWVWKSLEGSSFYRIGGASPGSAWSKPCSLEQKSFTFLIHLLSSLSAPKRLSLSWVNHPFPALNPSVTSG